jgi:general secretion pathway protein A
MYLDFYDLKSKPFSLLPDPNYLFLSSKHRAALAHLEHGLIDQTGFVLITGDVGTGKTTLLKYMIRSLDKRFQTAMIFNTRVSPLEFIQMILREFDLGENPRQRSQCYMALYDFLLKQYALGNRCLLIIDEAQNLSPHTLEEIRMLSNLNEEEEGMIQIIMAGQPSLKTKLERKDMKQFSQRITMDCILEPMAAEETRNYILHRLSVAGWAGGDDLFTPEAQKKIYDASRGVPRLINMLCDWALVYGFADERKRIDADIIGEVLSDRKIKGQFFVSKREEEAPPETRFLDMLVRKTDAISRRVELLEKTFIRFQDGTRDQAIQKLEQLLAEESKRAGEAIRECGQKDVIIEGLKRRVSALEDRLREIWQDRTKPAKEK